MRWYYLPVVDGKAAAWDGQQLAFCDVLPHWQDSPHFARLYLSVDEINKHIAESQEFRRKAGWTDLGVYGYVQVCRPYTEKGSRRRSATRSTKWRTTPAGRADGGGE